MMEDDNLLLVAACLGETETVEKLIKDGYQLNNIDKQGRPAVTVAVEQGHFNVVKLLVEAGCELNESFTITNENIESRVRDDSREVTEASDFDTGGNNSSSLSDSGEVTHVATTPIEKIVFLAPPLHAAVYSEHDDIVEYLISTNRVDVNSVYKKETPLIIAAKFNSQTLVTMLVEAGANVNFDKSVIMDDGLTTPIHYAVVAGNYEMVKYFIDHGAKYITDLPLDVRTYRIPGAIALRYFGSLIELACQNKQPRILDLLIDSYERDITFLCKHFAMLWCCQMDCKECLDILLDRLYSTDCELNNSFLAQNHQQVLRIALRQNSSKDEVIPLRLLEHFGSKMFIDSTSYYIMLHIGVLRVFPKFVTAMIAFVKQFPPTEDDETVQDICYSALNGGNLSILKDLFSAGLIDVKYIDHAGENAAFNVVQSSKTAEIDDLVTWLSGLGVDFTMRNNKGLGPIHTTVSARTYKNIEVLVRHGVDINSVTSDGETSLHLALNTGWELERPVVQTLLDNGADINMRDPLGRTPVTMLILSYFSTFQTGQTWCLEARNGWQWALDLLVNKLGCFLYNVHVVGHVTEQSWQTLVDVLTPEQRSILRSFPSLQTLCWSRIRGGIGGIRFKDRVDMLPLPQPLTNYIKMF